jgi:IS5 family transposase
VRNSPAGTRASCRTPAEDKGYDSQPLRDTLREMGIRPPVKHRVFAPYDHAHNARIEDELYNQRSMTERVNGTVSSAKSS